MFAWRLQEFAPSAIRNTVLVLIAGPERFIAHPAMLHGAENIEESGWPVNQLRGNLMSNHLPESAKFAELRSQSCSSISQIRPEDCDPLTANHASRNSAMPGETQNQTFAARNTTIKTPSLFLPLFSGITSSWSAKIGYARFA